MSCGTAPVTERDIKDAFERAMIDAGLRPVWRSGEGVVIGHNRDGKPNRFHVEGDSKGTRNGWYILFADGVPAGEFGSWKTGASHTWCMKSTTDLSPEERAAMKARLDEARKLREKQQREREGEAAKIANLLWNEAQPADDEHPYLVRKGIHAYGLRIASWPVRNRDGEVFRHIDDTLIVPIMDAKGKIVSLQGIFPKVDQAFGRDKDFLVGGRKRGCFFIIGKPREGTPVAICEGYATAASIHAATGWCVVIAWDAYNVPHVAKEMREAMPRAEFVVCADNDRWTTTPVENPGVHYGRMAAAEIGARLVWPEFAHLDGDDDRPTDFNDLHCREGIEAVQAQVMTRPAASVPATVNNAASDDGDDDAGSTTLAAGYNTARSVIEFDTFTPFPEIDGKGNPLPTAYNLAELCRRIGAVVRYNVILKDYEVLIPHLRTTVDNAKQRAIQELLNCHARVRMPVGQFDGNLCSIGDSNPYNPVAAWIESKPWDGVSRLQEFYDTVTAKRDTKLSDGRSLKETLMRKWLVSAVAAAYAPNGVVARGVLTFISKQNLGKTHWAKRLAPADLDVIRDGVLLNPTDKDSVLSVVSNWIVELGEVDATFRKADIAALKAFISKQRDSVRRPYARAESHYPRRTIFFASVNDERFLADDTGNTRWWTIHVEALNYAHTVDMQQLWAEVKSIYDSGESWHLNPEEIAVLNDSNRDHEKLSPVAELIDGAFDWDTPSSMWTNAMRATEILHAAGVERPTKADINEAASYVTKTYNVESRKAGKARTKVWMMPPRVAAHYRRGSFDNGSPL